MVSRIVALNNLFKTAPKFATQSPLIITPATCGQAPKIEGEGYVNGEETPAWVDFTMGINMTRNPAGVIPAGILESGMPVALQIFLH